MPGPLGMARSERQTMILPGHIASVLLATHFLNVDRRVALGASLFPDAVDKALHWLARCTPSDRLWAHAAWTFAGSSLLASLIGRATGHPQAGRSWLIGYTVHLLGDVSAPLAFFYPLSKRGYHSGARFREILRGERALSWKVLAAEGLLALAAVATEVYFGGKGKSSAKRCAQ